MSNEDTNKVDTDTTEVEKKFSQEDVERILSERLERKDRKVNETISAMEQKLAEYEREKLEREQAELSELELVKRQKEEADNRLKQLENEIKQTRLEALKTGIIAEKAASLPKAYKSLVSGTNEEEILESLKEVQKQFDEDFAQVKGNASIGSPTSGGVKPQVNESNPEGHFKSPYQEMMEKIEQRKQS